jgi:hypothetical protein
MFTIKVFNRKGYTAYSCESFEVCHDKNEGSSIYLHSAGVGDTTARRVFIYSEAIVENENGKTIDRIKSMEFLTGDCRGGTMTPPEPMVIA